MEDYLEISLKEEVSSCDSDEVGSSNRDEDEDGEEEEEEEYEEQQAGECFEEEPGSEDAFFQVGKRFDTLEELEEAQQQYQYANYCELWKRDVRTLESAKKRAPNRVNTAKAALRYYSVKLSCKFGGKAPVQRTDKKRSSCSFRQGCPFEVYLRLSADGNALEVLNVNDIHNHALTRDAFRPHPQPHISEAERYARALRTALSLASSACAGGMKLFNMRLSQMNGLLRQWRSIDGHCGQTSREADEVLDHFLAHLGDKEVKNALQMSSKGMKFSVQKSKTGKEGESGYTTEESMIKTKTNEKGSDKQIDSRVVTRMSRRGRSKGRDPPSLTMSQSAKKVKHDTLVGQPKPFRKLRVREKHQVMLECFVSSPAAKKALQGTLILPDEVQTDIKCIPDLVRDEDNVDLQQVERYFTSEAWNVVLGLVKKKENSQWICAPCAKTIKENERSVACERCLSWFHFPCALLSKRPPREYWFCRDCISKYV
ncbi:uncharacterized protein LOC122248876 [Penaeus japonicus]|uniref:uncharacterized protein LOC122248876 n=1 Tax=Penaeus japonicus TaxID=27405 RepID=UPI001C70DBCF|nr:uncharacterized protein LOC122248876 [Penaeus japonicus]